MIYPALIKAEGRCPPEDIGGPPGYEMYLDAAADPEHEEHDWMIECTVNRKIPKKPLTNLEFQFITTELQRLANRCESRSQKTSPRS